MTNDKKAITITSRAKNGNGSVNLIAQGKNGSSYHSALNHHISHMNKEARGVPYLKPLPMGIYSPLWEADDWATRGGLEKIDWSKAPFHAYYKERVALCPARRLAPLWAPTGGKDHHTSS